MKSTEITPKQAMHSTQAVTNEAVRKSAAVEEQGFWDRLEFYRVAIIVSTLAAVGCCGGIMALYAITMPSLVLITGVCLSMITLSLVIGMAPVRWILPAAVITVVVDLIIILSAVLG